MATQNPSKTASSAIFSFCFSLLRTLRQRHMSNAAVQQETFEVIHKPIFHVLKQQIKTTSVLSYI